MPKNIAVITKIAWAAHEYCFQNIKFQSQSASYSCDITGNVAGSLSKHRLSFTLTGLTSHTSDVVTRLSRAEIFAITDINGMYIEIGNKDIPLEFKISKNISGAPGSFRGYRITVTWDAPTYPLPPSFSIYS